ncbi:MAG: CarD family transcriptional regulator [Clostridia bacterium]|nr:CarD family transcriptional regulator [Clostridia bacterium]
MFHIGQSVTHPIHGAGQITGTIEQRSVQGPRMYYILTLQQGGLQLYIPCDGCEKAGLRPTITPQEAQSLLRALPALTAENNTNWNRRYRENMEHLRSGDPMQVALVIKSLSVRSGTKPLSTGEQKMLTTARQILISELSVALACTRQEAENLLRAALT